ncbi:DUF177 domain-containing protein [Oricola sp.]|uniref:YceD family protein n=1 Tax=Oricola sp. TaxID=1979950 RepID=UPI0025CC4426|nr:DUF177 domain-containing protein [Oricola sp.]MCI5077099.1 DUF177 domain-containing protein [Oricola sp.]
MTERISEGGASSVSRPVVVSVLPSAGFPVRIDADEKERAALAEAHGLDAVESFVADLEVKRWRKDGVRVVGTVHARVVQSCVVTLETVISDLDAPVDAVFLPEGSRMARPLDEDGALIVDPEGADIPEMFEGGVIDAGLVAEEFFELAIDPYPRAPGAAMEEGTASQADGSEDEASESPFSGLAALRDKL